MCFDRTLNIYTLKGYNSSCDDSNICTITINSLSGKNGKYKREFCSLLGLNI